MKAESFKLAVNWLRDRCLLRKLKGLVSLKLGLDESESELQRKLVGCKPTE